MPRLLLFSNSTNFGQGYLDHALAEIDDFLGPVRSLLFVPFALANQEAYGAKARARLAAIGVEVETLRGDRIGGAAQLAAAQSVFVGGGNTFRLLATLQRSGLLEPLRERIASGMPYLGASAGINLAGPTIRTTNDMPIVEPESFAALALVPFQINPHYLDADPGSRHMGETREERLREYLEENERPVLGLREGGWLRMEGDVLTLGGAAARVFRRGRDPEELLPGATFREL